MKMINFNLLNMSVCWCTNKLFIWPLFSRLKKNDISCNHDCTEHRKDNRSKRYNSALFRRNLE